MEVRQDQSRQRQEHLLGANWSLLQLNGFLWLCVYFSFVVCALFPSPLKQGRLTLISIPTFPVSDCLSASFTFPLYLETKEAVFYQAAARWLIPEVPPQDQLLPGRSQYWKEKKRKMWWLTFNLDFVLFLWSFISCCCIFFSEIFDLQRQLDERGHMKTYHDLEDFYSCIKYNGHPSQLQRSLQDIRKKS